MTINKIETARTLLKYTGDDKAQTDAVIRGVISILASVIEEDLEAPAKTEPDPKPKATKPKTDTKTKKRQPFDVGKLGALRKAGWSVSKIADEMGCSEATVYTYMKKEGIV